MKKYIKTMFSFVQTYILLIFMIVSPLVLHYILNPSKLFMFGGIALEVIVLIIYFVNLVNVKEFKNLYNKNNYLRLLDYHYFKKEINRQSSNIRDILENFYTEARNILDNVNADSMKDMIAQALLNVLNIGESYSSLEEKINKNIGTKYQQKEMISRNKEKLLIIKTSYDDLKELGGKLVLMSDDDNRNEKYVLDQLSMMNKIFETEIKK